MAILISCSCGRQSQTGDENAGRRATCPGCGREIIVPRPLTPAPAQPVIAPAGTPSLPFTGKAIASLLLGLLSFACVFVSGIPAIVLGVQAMREIKASRGRVRGRGLAVAGIVTGAFGSTAIALVLIVPAVTSALEDLHREQCSSHLKLIGTALSNYARSQGRFPPAAITNKQGHPLLSWRVAILPYLGSEEQKLFNRFHLDEPWDSPRNLALLNERPELFVCPSAHGLGTSFTRYQVVVGPRTVFPASHRPVGYPDIRDGTSNTILVVESGTPVPWTAPQDLKLDMNVTFSGAASDHFGGFFILMADGAVRFFPDTTTPNDFPALATRDGGEMVTRP